MSNKFIAFYAVISTAFAVCLAQPIWADEESSSTADVPIRSISVSSPRILDATFTLKGRDTGQQLVVHGDFEDNSSRDVTRQVSFEVQPEGVVTVDSTGWVAPLSDGEAVIHIHAADGVDATMKVQVSHLATDVPINFPNEVVPVFTKYGCNSGGCHGKSGGQNGFRLSLLGFEPTEDFEFLVKEGRGRRVFPAAPEQSLLLTKPTGILPHGGGQRFDLDTPAYRVIRRWIDQGLPYGNADDPTIVRIEVTPGEQLMKPNAHQQLTVAAFYTDGSTKDVTRTTQFESNDKEMAEVSETGLVSTTDSTGSVSIMARYQSQVGVFRATVPLGAPVDNLPEPKNFIDELVFAKLLRLGLPPSASSDDTTFLRRVTIDVAGRLPTISEAEEFLADQREDKREQLVDRLLASEDYADWFANKWSSILRNKRKQGNKHVSYSFHDWIREAIYQNKPYDQFVREIITATGAAGMEPAVSWYQGYTDVHAQVEDIAQLFLGLRIQCARCHHHPFEKWSQQDYYGFTAFFTRVGRKPSKRLANFSDIYHDAGLASATNPKTGQPVTPSGLGAEPLQIPADEDPRIRLADWMSSQENPFFARGLVNRYWKHFFGRGLVDPEDDMRVTNPASNPSLLDALAQHFAASDFDLKELVRTICTSRVYGLSAEPNEHNRRDKQNFSRFFPRRLQAEVLLDAIDGVTSSPSAFGGLPAGTRAIQLPDNAFDSYFLTVFGRPESNSVCECERSSEASLAQSLHLLNSQEIQTKIAGQRAEKLAGDSRSHEEKVRELYLVAFSREPNNDETSLAVAYLTKNEAEPKTGYEDIIWSLINTKEFLFNH